MTHDLEQELNECEWVVAKVRNNKPYAQNLYAALCNMQWQKQEIMPVLKDDFWSCTWRYAGGLVAGIENQGGDYMDWYCSGSLGNPDNHGHTPRCYVGEGVVTDEIREDLAQLGWIPVEWEEDND